MKAHQWLKHEEHMSLVATFTKQGKKIKISYEIK